MPTKNRFIGRNNELKRLLNLTKKTTASFVVVKGRRRIGKSRLIAEFSKSFDHFYKFEGLPPEKEVTAFHQLEEFSKQMTRQLKTASVKYADWSDAFWVLGEKVQTGKILLFFDELSWMGSKDPTFLAKIKNLWDSYLSKNNQLIFVACSSASAWIEKNLLSSVGFVGRISLTITLEELTLAECDQFWPKNISPYEKFKVLSVVGGIPKYLEEINPKQSAEENIKQLCFTRGGFLVDEFNRIFSDLFLRESLFYRKIISLLSKGAKEQLEIQNEIFDRRQDKHFGRISEYLWELEEAGFISRDYTWNIKTGENLKLSKFRLKDNYLRFYLKYIEKNLERIKHDIFFLKSLTSLPEWNTIMGIQFENLILNNRKAVQKMLGIKSEEVIIDNPFFQRKTNRTPGCQIDYMIQTKFSSLYICEIKFSKHEITTSILKEMRSKIDALKFPKGFSYRPVLIHVNGVSDDVIDSDYFSEIIDMSELLKSE